MPDIVNVSWPGQHIAEDTTHRLVTDAQIEKWNKINNISGDDQYIELTPENISQYTCTKPDEYWTDMGLADGTIFDSSSLDEGNYIIKLGMDKLIKNPNVSSPTFRFGKEGYTYDDYLKKRLELTSDGTALTHDEYAALMKELHDSLGYQAYVNYTIETQTFLFLCMFFGQELSLTDLLGHIYSNYACEIVLATKLTDRESLYGKTIKWPEAIKIKITKEQYGPENNMYVLRRYLFFDMNIVDYFNCYNYKWNGEGDIEEASLTDEDYGIATLAGDGEEDDGPWVSEDPNYSNSWIPCEFTGVPLRYISSANSAVPYYSRTLTSKTSREYIIQSGVVSNDIDANIYMPQPCKVYDSIYVHPSYLEEPDIYFKYGYSYNETIIDNSGISIKPGGYWVTTDLPHIAQYDELSGTTLNSDGLYAQYIDYSDAIVGIEEDIQHNAWGPNTIWGRGYSTRVTSTEIAMEIISIEDVKCHSELLRINKDYFCYCSTTAKTGDRYPSTVTKFTIDSEDGSFRGIRVFTRTNNNDYKKLTFTENGLEAEFIHPLKIKLNDTTTYTYNNTEDVTVDLSELGTKNTKVINWDTALTPGHYYSDLDATNAPYNTLSGQLQGPVVFTKKETFGFCGTVERIGDNLVIQHLYSGTNCDMNQYIRKGVSTSSDASIFEEDVDKDGWIFGEWYCVEFSTGSSEACAPFGFKGVPA